MTEKSHGRLETRELQALPVTAERLGFPFGQQLILLHRVRDYLADGHREEGWLHLVCSRPGAPCGPAALLAHSRGHWIIESSVHYCRDVSLGEDRCRVSAVGGARVLATLRALSVWLLGRRRRTRRDTRRRQQKRLTRHPGLAVRLVLVAP